MLSADTTFNSDHFSLSKSSNDPLSLNVDSETPVSTNDENLLNSNLNSQHSQQLPPQQRTNTNFNLKTLFIDLFRSPQGLQMQKQRVRFRIIECITGKEIIDWLMKNQRASVQTEAKLLGQCFLNETYLEPVIQPQTSFVEFKPDQTLYKFGKVTTNIDFQNNSPFFSYSIACIRT